MSRLQELCSALAADELAYTRGPFATCAQLVETAEGIHARAVLGRVGDALGAPRKRRLEDLLAEATAAWPDVRFRLAGADAVAEIHIELPDDGLDLPLRDAVARLRHAALSVLPTVSVLTDPSIASRVLELTTGAEE